MRIEIYDTTLRDGSQGEGVNFSLQDKLLITQRLDEMGFDYVEGGYPLSNEKDAQFFQKVKTLNLQHARIAAFGCVDSVKRERYVFFYEPIGSHSCGASFGRRVESRGRCTDYYSKGAAVRAPWRRIDYHSPEVASDPRVFLLN